MHKNNQLTVWSDLEKVFLEYFETAKQPDKGIFSHCVNASSCNIYRVIVALKL